jgi:hypothetical protein
MFASISETRIVPSQNLVISRQIAMLHTVSSLIPLFDGLAKQHLPHWQGFNMLDESLLRGTIRDGALSKMTMWRLTQMVQSAVEAGASAVVVTCSSLGPAVDAAQPFCQVPLFRIDQGMAEAAVTLGLRIGVLATLRSTLDPTSDLIRRAAAKPAILAQSCPSLPWARSRNWALATRLAMTRWWRKACVILPRGPMLSCWRRPRWRAPCPWYKTPCPRFQC